MMKLVVEVVIVIVSVVDVVVVRIVDRDGVAVGECKSTHTHGGTRRLIRVCTMMYDNAS